MTTKNTEPTTVTVKHPVIDGVTYEVPAKGAEDWKNAGWQTDTAKDNAT